MGGKGWPAGSPRPGAQRAKRLRLLAVSERGARRGAIRRAPAHLRLASRSEGERGTDHDRSPRTDRREPDTVEGAPLIGRMGQHTMPQGCKRIRYAGGQAPQTLAPAQVMLQEACAQVQDVVTGAEPSLARQRYAQSTGRAPVRCPHGRGAMGVGCIWSPTYGVIHEEGQGINRGTYPSTTQRVGPGRKGECFKSPPIGRYVQL